MISIPTAEEFLDPSQGFMDNHDVKEALIKFAKLHTEAALEAAGTKALEIQNPDKRRYVGKRVIIASYPLENIK